MNDFYPKAIIKLTVVLYTALVLGATTGMGQSNQKAVEEVRQCFNGYKQSIMDQTGTEAVKYIDLNILTYYSDMLSKIKHANQQEIDSMSMFDKLMIITVRHNSTSEDLNNFTPEALFVKAVNEAWVGKETIANMTIGEVEIEKKQAKGYLLSSGQSIPFYFMFSKKDGRWKVDLKSVTPIINFFLEHMARQSGISQNELLIQLVEILSGRAVNSNIWDPIQ